MGVTFFWKKSDDYSLVIASESDDIFSCRLLTTAIFPRVYPVFFLNSATKNFLCRVSPPKGVTRAVASPRIPLLTPLGKLVV